MTRKDDRLYAKTGFSRTLIKRFKTSLAGARWAPETKEWHFPINERNIFQLSAMAGQNPYEPYRSQVDYTNDILAHCSNRGIELYKHQIGMINLILNGRRVLVAAEMGTGKTLASIISLEMFDCDDVLWIGPKTPLDAVKLDFKKWGTELNTTFMTYEGAKNRAKAWVGDYPSAIVFDESSKLKNNKAQRSVAAYNLCRELHEDAAIIALSGTPAAKKPTDYWHQIEILCPGFIKERDIFQFTERLAFMDEGQGTDGHMFKQVKCWKDSEDLCDECGDHKEDWKHPIEHQFVPSKNEIKRLGDNLAGIMGVWFKKDCTDLPELRFEKFYCKPTEQMLQIAEAAVASTTRGCDALIMLRTISDGFKYIKVDNNKRQPCEQCEEGKIIQYIDPVAPHDPLSATEREQGTRMDGDKVVPITAIEKKYIDCYTCGGTGQTIIYDQEVEEVHSPKLDALEHIMGNHEEVGRLNVFAGFHGSIDRIVRHCNSLGWNTFRIDGRGWEWKSPEGTPVGLTNEQMLQLFQKQLPNYPDKVVFVGHPMAAGMGITLHAAPTSVFYSNDFSPENRLQACARGHRLGMLPNGGLIIDLIHLESDQLVIDSLERSENLQSISMNAVLETFGGSNGS